MKLPPCLPFLHRWSLWGEPKLKGGTFLYQYRTCSRCGKTQERML